MRRFLKGSYSYVVRGGLLLAILVGLWMALATPALRAQQQPQAQEEQSSQQPPSEEQQQPTNPITDSLTNLASPLLDTFDSPLQTRWIYLDGRRVLLIAAPALSGDGGQEGATSPIGERAAEIERNLKDIAREVVSSSDTPNVQRSVAPSNNSLTVINVNGQYLMTVTSRDAQIAGAENTQIAADSMVDNIRRALKSAMDERTPEYLRASTYRALGIAIGTVVLTWLLLRLRLGVIRYLTEQLEAFAEPMPIPQPDSPDRSENQIELDAEVEAERVAARQRLREQKGRLKFTRDFINLALKGIRVGVVIAGGLAILNLFPQTRYIKTDLLTWFTTFALEVLIIIAGTYMAFRISFIGINWLFTNLSSGQFFKGGTSIRLSNRLKTVSGVLKSLSATIIISIGVLAFLSSININLAPVLAGAGLIGLAISFASQSLVKDLLNGFFILLEDQFSEGDVIATGGVAGIVEDLNLRVTRLRSADGNLIVVPNSTISVVENLTNGFSRANLGIEVAYDTDLDFAISTIENVADEMANDPDWKSLIVKQPEMLGVDSFGNNSITIRLWIDTQPLKQWAVGREFRRRLKYAFDRCGISIPFPQRSIWFETPLKTQDKSLSETEIQQLIEQRKRSNGDLHSD